MKTSFTTIAIVSLVAVSAASAEHRHHRGQPQPGRLAHALHVQAHHLEQEIAHHYPHAHGTHQRTYIISRLAKSVEAQVRSGHRLGARQTLGYLHGLLHEVETFSRRSTSNGHRDGCHVRRSIAEMDAMIVSLEHALNCPALSVPDRGHSRVHIQFGDGGHRGDGRFGRVAGFGTRYSGNHRDHDHGDRDAYDDHDRHDHHERGRRGAGFRGRGR